MVNKLKLSLHTKQKEIFLDRHRFKVVVCGRRFGKTELAGQTVAYRAIKNPGWMIWLIAPTFPQTMYLWRRIKRFIPPGVVANIKEGEKSIELKNGSAIFAKSGDNPDSLVGEGLNFCIVDEASRCKEEVWEVIRPALADKLGECWFLSTPVGKNWFWEQSLTEKKDEEYKTFHFTSWDNPLLDRKELEKMKTSLPELIYRQEIMAEFIDSGGVVFRTFHSVLNAQLKPPEPGHVYVEAADVAKYQDFTVITVADTATNEVVYLERFNRLDWEYVRGRISDVSRLYYDALVIIDSTGVGEPVYEELKKVNLPIQPYKFTAGTKPQLINNLMLMIENKSISLPPIEELIHEFNIFEYKLSETGTFTYKAPHGHHDDIVTSVALVAWGLDRAYGVNVVGIIDGDTPAEQTEGRPREESEKSLWDKDDDVDVVDWDAEV